MKFQCGECEKNFIINNIHTAENELEFQCDNCTNKFTINRSLAFSSSNKNSKVFCGNCGKLIPEANKVCDSCNLILNKIHEELRIDNKEYEPLEIKENGYVCNTNSGKKLNIKKRLLPVIIAGIFVLFIALGGYWFKTNNLLVVNATPSQKAARIETQIIIMKSGHTYYADKLEKDGGYLRITSKNGTISKILESNILQISKAVIEE